MTVSELKRIVEGHRTQLIAGSGSSEANPARGQTNPPSMAVFDAAVDVLSTLERRIDDLERRPYPSRELFDKAVGVITSLEIRLGSLEHRMRAQ